MTVVLVQFSSHRDGSAFSGLLLADALAAAGLRVHVIFGADGPMVEVYEKHGHEVEVVRHKNWLRDQHLVRAMRNLSQEWWNAESMADRIGSAGADLVYVNTGASYAGALAARRLEIPCIWHLREMFSDAGGELVVPRRMRWWVRREFRQLSCKIVVNSRAVAGNLLGERAGEATVIPNAIQGRDFGVASAGEVEELKTRLTLRTQDTVIGIPGTLRPMKGHRFALRALESLLKERPDSRIVITGGPRDDFGRELVTGVGVSRYASQIRWTGDLPSLDPFYGLCDAVVIPSSSEPFGRTVIEAMARGLPVVATRVGGIPEIIDHGENGLLVEYGNELGLLTAVERILGDQAMRRELGDSARVKARREYSESVHARRILEVVERVCLTSGK